MPQSTPDPAADMTQAEVSAAHLVFSHLPEEPDTDDGHLEAPGAMPVARSLLTAAFMFFIAFAAWLVGWPIFSVAFCVVGVAFFVAFFVFSNTLIRNVLARQDATDLAAAPWAYTSDTDGGTADGGAQDNEDGGDGGLSPAGVRQRVERLGGYLADPNNPVVRLHMQVLGPRRRKAYLAHRAAEADASWSWIQAQPDFAEVRCTAEDGVELVGHELACNPSSPRWLVFAHDYRGSWREGMLYARRFAEHGYNLLFVELRGHGKSGGAYVGLGWLDRRDLVAWVRDLVERKRAEGAGQDPEVVLMGHSMGATAVCLAAGESDLPEQVRAIVSDCAYVDTWNMLLALVRRTGLDAHPMSDFARLLFRTRRGSYDVSHGDAESSVEAARIPCLFLHGRYDCEVSPYHSARLYMAAGGRAAGNRLVTFPRASHCESFLSDPDSYFDAVWSFLDPLM